MTLVDSMLPAWARVVGVRRETLDVWTIALAPPAEDGKWAYSPGQFNMLYAFGIGEVPISISGSARRQGALLHSVRAVGAVSRALTSLKRGDIVGVRGPYGSAWPMEQATGHDVVVAAGGVGVAPVRPVLRALIAQRERYGKLIFLYGARHPEEILYRRELDAWRRRIDVEVTVDHATSAWHGHVGVVTTLVRRAAFDPQKCVAMLCGPEVMMRFTVAALRDVGVSEASIYLSLERNMQCAIGLCGHCQFGTDFVCKDGPVFRYDRIRERLATREV